MRTSQIHGRGLFADEDIPAKSLVWRFEHPVDWFCPLAAANQEMMDRGYVNPCDQNWLVVCGDDSQFINFSNGETPTLRELRCDGESVLLASRDIQKGEELTVDPSTDADYERKMGIVK